MGVRRAMREVASFRFRFIHLIEVSEVVIDGFQVNLPPARGRPQLLLITVLQPAGGCTYHRGLTLGYCLAVLRGNIMNNPPKLHGVFLIERPPREL